jgi:hypothetical protein
MLAKPDKRANWRLRALIRNSQSCGQASWKYHARSPAPDPVARLADERANVEWSWDMSVKVVGIVGSWAAATEASQIEHA